MSVTPIADERALIAHMQRLIDGWEPARDRRAVFLTCYQMMTRNMLVRLAEGGFANTPWVNALLFRFSEYYFDALAADAAEPARAPLVWQRAFAATRDPDRHVLQHLMLGVNAHISYDLVLALADLLRPDWSELAEPGRHSRYQDHCLVNDVICGTLDAVQDGVVERYSPAMDRLDRGFGRLDEWATRQMIARWRAGAWDDALRLISASPADVPALHAEIEARAVRRADAILGVHGVLGLFALL